MGLRPIRLTGAGYLAEARYAAPFVAIGQRPIRADLRTMFVHPSAYLAYAPDRRHGQSSLVPEKYEHLRCLAFGVHIDYMRTVRPDDLAGITLSTAICRVMK